MNIYEESNERVDFNLFYFKPLTSQAEKSTDIDSTNEKKISNTAETMCDNKSTVSRTVVDEQRTLRVGVWRGR